MIGAIEEVALLDRPQVLIPLATPKIVDMLAEYLPPRNFYCMNTDRSQLLSIIPTCYKLPADFLSSHGRVSLQPNFDLAYLPPIPSYWYIAREYVLPGGYMVGEMPKSDPRFERWVAAMDGYEGEGLVVQV